MTFQHQQAIVKQHIEQLKPKTNELSSSFYTHLFRINPSLTHIFNGGVTMLNRKFISMLSTFKSVHDLQTIASALEGMAKRHIAYHAEAEHFAHFNQALLLALQDIEQENFTPALQQAWQTVFSEVSTIMTSIIRHAPKQKQSKSELDRNTTPLIEDIGGVEVVTRVHKRFYDDMYEDKYLGPFFHHRAKHTLVRKQTEFMVAAFGGENNYTGEPPAFIHMHMYITKEMSDIREIYLRRAILAEGLSDDICERWLAIDRSFHASIEKNSVDECVMRVWGQHPFVVKKPATYIPPSL